MPLFGRGGRAHCSSVVSIAKLFTRCLSLACTPIEHRYEVMDWVLFSAPSPQALARWQDSTWRSAQVSQHTALASCHRFSPRVLTAFLCALGRCGVTLWGRPLRTVPGTVEKGNERCANTPDKTNAPGNGKQASPRSGKKTWQTPCLSGTDFDRLSIARALFITPRTVINHRHYLGAGTSGHRVQGPGITSYGRYGGWRPRRRSERAQFACAKQRHPVVCNDKLSHPLQTGPRQMTNLNRWPCAHRCARFCTRRPCFPVPFFQFCPCLSQPGCTKKVRAELAPALISFRSVCRLCCTARRGSGVWNVRSDRGCGHRLPLGITPKTVVVLVTNLCTPCVVAARAGERELPGPGPDGVLI